MATLAGKSAALKWQEDLLLAGSSLMETRPSRTRRVGRPVELSEIQQLLGDILLAYNVPLMAKFNAGKIMTLLDRAGIVISDTAPASPQPLLDSGREILRKLCQDGGQYGALARGLLRLMDRIEWTRGGGGPFASLDFGRSHLHALLVEPEATEHRTDLRVGLTLMAPYTRFPDHRQYHSKVFLPLTMGEFRFGDEHWLGAGQGDILFNGAGRLCAIRCTGRPLFILWCHLQA
ncbi:dimethylsulfonioproprionate lyase family protein [Agrobacterium sp. MCAB5]|uniref:dimethylsulfonioproprionate lyase family protein n=1 Tax=Agrobacterium sp. MCAB5 TaxID=3233042 RepID=UPI003F929600